VNCLSLSSPRLGLSYVVRVSLCAALLSAFCIEAAHAQGGLSSAQRQTLEQLTPAQREAVLRQVRPQHQRADSASEDRAGSETIDDEERKWGRGGPDGHNSESRQRTGPLVASGRDTLVLVLRLSGADGVIDESNNESSARRGNLTYGDLTAHVRSLLGRSVHTLDADARLNLRGVGAISLKGLTSDQVSLRLSAEPAFQGLQVVAELLPVEPVGVQALKRFGVDLFHRAPDGTDRAMLPVPADYRVGPGDDVRVQFFGKESQEFRLVVNRDGALNIPHLGPVNVAGMRFNEMQEIISARVSEQMIGVRAGVTLGQLRSIRVFLAGDVEEPGAHQVSAHSTVTSALFASGGVLDSGSLRRIRLVRNGKGISQLDLYDLLLDGDTGGDREVVSGDTIFVPPVQSEVKVVGAVRRPAIYELKGEESLQDVLSLAGGLRANADRAALQLERINDSGERDLRQLNLKISDAQNISLRDGDAVLVHEVAEEARDAIHVHGHVYQEGRYAYEKGIRLVDVLPSERALKPEADLRYVLILRKESETGFPYARSLDLSEHFNARASSDRARLKPRDEVFVFSRDEDRAALLEDTVDFLRGRARLGFPEGVVQVAGSVRFPGEYPLEPAMQLSDLIRAAGGLQQEAYSLEAELVRYEVVDQQRREMRRVEVDLRKALETGARSQDVELRPFDSLSIRRTPDWTERLVVEVDGEVGFPGSYTVKDGETVSDIVMRAGGLTDDAHAQGAVFLRESLREREEEQLARLRRRLQADVAGLSLRDDSREGGELESFLTAQRLMRELEEAEALGRLVIDLEALLAPGGEEKLVLENGDQLLIPKKPDTVTVIGEVNYATSHFYRPNLGRDDFIDRSGGMTANADKKRIYIVRANGQVDVAGKRWFGGANPDIEPGDTIIVPLDVRAVSPILLTSNLTQILSQLAITAASLSAVGAF